MDNRPAIVLELSPGNRAALAQCAAGLREALALPAAQAKEKILEALGAAWSAMDLDGIETTLAGRGKDLLRSAVEALPAKAAWAVQAWLKVNGATRAQITNVLDEALDGARKRWPEVKAAALAERETSKAGASA